MNKNNVNESSDNQNESSDKNINTNEDISRCLAEQIVSTQTNKELFLQIGEDNIESCKLDQIELINLNLLKNNTVNGDLISEKEAKKLIKGNEIRIVKANCEVLDKDLNIIPKYNIMIMRVKPNTKIDDSGDHMTNKQIVEILLSIQNNVENLKTDVKDLKEDVKGLKEDMVQVKDRLTNLEGDVKGLKEDMVQVKDRLTNIENKFDDHMNKYHSESL